MEEGHEVFVLSDQSLESLRQMAATVSELSAAVASINQSIERFGRVLLQSRRPLCPHSPQGHSRGAQRQELGQSVWIDRTLRRGVLTSRQRFCGAVTEQTPVSCPHGPCAAPSPTEFSRTFHNRHSIQSRASCCRAPGRCFICVAITGRVWLPRARALQRCLAAAAGDGRSDAAWKKRDANCLVVLSLCAILELNPER
jgi:hypothetical protein